VDRPAKQELEWQDLRHLPHYSRFQNDFTHSFQAPLAGQLTKGLRDNLLSSVPDCNPSRNKLALVSPPSPLPLLRLVCLLFYFSMLKLKALALFTAANHNATNSGVVFVSNIAWSTN